MRDIAAAAGVATGAAYYYFQSKEELVMAFYVRTAEEARQILPQRLARSRDLRKRIAAVIDLKFEQFAQHRRLLVALVRIGIDPSHPLSPFGKNTEPLREESIEGIRAAIDGSSTRVPKDLRKDLPALLWLYHVGLLLFWMFDESPKQRRTRALMDGSLDLIVRLVQLSSLPLMGPLRKRVISVLRAIEG
jgi:AcrR family transcriptional regulator